jgi:hypothetical protein
MLPKQFVNETNQMIHKMKMRYLKKLKGKLEELQNANLKMQEEVAQDDNYVKKIREIGVKEVERFDAGTHEERVE